MEGDGVVVVDWVWGREGGRGGRWGEGKVGESDGGPLDHPKVKIMIMTFA